MIGGCAALSATTPDKAAQSSSQDKIQYAVPHIRKRNQHATHAGGEVLLQPKFNPATPEHSSFSGSGALTTTCSAL
jgi:hypothetical protein